MFAASWSYNGKSGKVASILRKQLHIETFQYKYKRVTPGKKMRGPSSYSENISNNGKLVLIIVRFTRTDC